MHLCDSLCKTSPSMSMGLITDSLRTRQAQSVQTYLTPTQSSDFSVLMGEQGNGMDDDSLCPSPPVQRLITNTTLRGWEADTIGYLNPSRIELHVNFLELLAVHEGCIFLLFIQTLHIQITSDNSRLLHQ